MAAQGTHIGVPLQDYLAVLPEREGRITQSTAASPARTGAQW